MTDRDYWTRYYRNILGRPDWSAAVTARLDPDYEKRRVTRAEEFVGSFQDKRVLDVGCGTGAWLEEVRARGATVVAGTDPDPAAWRLAVGRGVRWPVADESFDIIYCYSVLEHIAYAQGTLDEIANRLTSRGRLLLGVPNGSSWTEPHYKLPYCPHWPLWVGALWLRLHGRNPALFWMTYRRPLDWYAQAAAAAGLRTIGAVYDTRTRLDRWLDIPSTALFAFCRAV